MSRRKSYSSNPFRNDLLFQLMLDLILPLNALYNSTATLISSQMNPEYNLKSSKVKVGILGAKVWQGQKKQGVELGPEKLRESGLVDRLKGLGIDVKDYGDVTGTCIPGDTAGKVNNPKAVSKYCKEIADRVEQIDREGRICLTLGGDHSLAAGSLHGHVAVHSSVRVVWIDAHTDLHLPYTTSSGSLHGCPMGLMVKELNTPGQNTLPDWEWHTNRIPARHLVYIGLRDVDAPEMYFLKKLGIRHFSTKDIDQHGIEGVARMAIQHINPNLDKPIVIQYDIDSLDPKDAPSTGTPVDGGMTLREGLVLMEALCRTRCIIGIDMVEVNVKLGNEQDEKKTLSAATKLIMAGLGEVRHGTLPLDFKVNPLPTKGKVENGGCNGVNGVCH